MEKSRMQGERLKMSIGRLRSLDTQLALKPALILSWK